MVKLAVIGCGYWGENHIKTLQKLNNLYAVADICADKAQTMAKRYDSKAYSIEQVWQDSAIDGVVLALPAQYHADYAIQAVTHGKDVLVEKPIALNLEQAQTAVNIAADNDKLFMVGHLLRYHSAFKKLLSLFESGTIGELRHIYAHRLGFGRFHNESDALWDLAPHDLSLILAVIKALPQNVTISRQAILGNLADNAQLDLSFAKGVRARVLVSRFSPYQERKLVLIGTKAMLIFDDMQDWPQKLLIKTYELDQSQTPCYFHLDKGDYVPVDASMPLTNELVHFIDCVKTRRSPLTDGQEALAVLRILTQQLI